MAYTQAFKRGNKLAAGRDRNKYYLCSIIIPKSLFNGLDWKKGDKLEFKIENNKVVLRRKK
jgi:AbrB family looped-hinge helix DNA binding protein